MMIAGHRDSQAFVRQSLCDICIGFMALVSAAFNFHLFV